MRKPRLSEKTIQKLYDEGRATSGKYEYTVMREWDDELNAYVDYLYRWDENNNCECWTIPAEGIWAFERT